MYHEKLVLMLGEMVLKGKTQQKQQEKRCKRHNTKHVQSGDYFLFVVSLSFLVLALFYFVLFLHTFFSVFASFYLLIFHQVFCCVSLFFFIGFLFLLFRATIVELNLKVCTYLF